MGTFNYEYLRLMSKKGEPLGKWKGKNVFSVEVNSLEDLGNGVWYIPYDDDRVIICREDDVFYVYGDVDENGQVEEYFERKVYKDLSLKPVSARKTVVPATEVSPVVGDVKLELDVNEVLKSARTMTVDSLLEGFNYGLK